MQGLHRAANAISLFTASTAPAAATVPNRSAVIHSWPDRTTADVRNASARSVIARATNIRTMRTRFAALRALRDGWDGSASVAPDRAIMARAASILEHALRDRPGVDAPAIVPVADGGLQAEWYTAAHRFEIYFEADGEVAAWSENRGTGVEYEAEGAEAEHMLVQWAARLNDERSASV